MESRFCKNCGTFLSSEHREELGEHTVIGANIFLDTVKAGKIGRILHEMFQTKTGYFKDYIMPEYSLPNNIRDGSLEQALYFTYAISIDKQTNAVNLWQNVRRTYEKHPEYFSPKIVSAMDTGFLSSLLRSLGARYPNNGVHTWKTISDILLKLYDGDPRNITREPLTVKQAKSLIQAFPQLKGRKLSNLYLRVMGEKGLLKIVNLKELDIPVDIQVARFTIFSGCLQLKNGTLSGCIHEPPIQPCIEEVWRNAAKGLDIAPWEIDEPIWTIGSKLCSTRYCNLCPVQHLCARNFDASIKANRLFWKR